MEFHRRDNMFRARDGRIASKMMSLPIVYGKVM
jgi:hypothetical protein